jgi:GNAT superfamily N-acetyltransferase
LGVNHLAAQNGRILVERVPPSVTHPLRRRVLRPGQPAAAARLAADAHPRAAAFAARDDDGSVVGTAIVVPAACPWLPEREDGWRLRGMATEERRRGAGVGSQVLAAVLEHVRAQGGRLVWCHARVPARRFYESAGFVAVGDEWVDPEIGPHIRMWREVAPDPET